MSADAIGYLLIGDDSAVPDEHPQSRYQLSPPESVHALAMSLAARSAERRCCAIPNSAAMKLPIVRALVASLIVRR